MYVLRRAVQYELFSFALKTITDTRNASCMDQWTMWSIYVSWPVHKSHGMVSIQKNMQFEMWNFMFMTSFSLSHLKGPNVTSVLSINVNNSLTIGEISISCTTNQCQKNHAVYTFRRGAPIRNVLRAFGQSDCSAKTIRKFYSDQDVFPAFFPPFHLGYRNVLPFSIKTA